MAVAAAAASAALAGCGAETDDRPATWSYISPAILQPSCATGSCHGRAAAAAGLDFSDPHRGYSSLTRLWVWVVDPTREGGPGCGTVQDGLVVCEHESRPLITPYDPAASRLVNVLRARNAPRMPPDRPLPEADIRLIERWILAGGGDGTPAPADAGTGDAGSGADAADATPSDGSVD